jgi:thioredoxin-like negative regulator of GroEL
LAFVDFDKKPELKEVFGIKRLPTTRTFIKGKMIDEIQIPVWPAVEIAIEKLLK